MDTASSSSISEQLLPFTTSWRLGHNHQDALDITKSTTQRQGDENPYVVCCSWPRIMSLLVAGVLMSSRGLDNAGKTTIVKRIMNEDVTTVSPTLGFIIKTIDFQG
jgi:hypothetical protein